MILDGSISAAGVKIKVSTVLNERPNTIEDANNVKIWHEIVNTKQGEFSTLVIAGGGGWENDGMYTLIVEQGDLENEIEFKFVA